MGHKVAPSRRNITFDVDKHTHRKNGVIRVSTDARGVYDRTKNGVLKHKQLKHWDEMLWIYADTTVSRVSKFSCGADKTMTLTVSSAETHIYLSMENKDIEGVLPSFEIPVESSDAKRTVTSGGHTLMYSITVSMISEEQTALGWELAVSDVNVSRIKHGNTKSLYANYRFHDGQIVRQPLVPGGKNGWKQITSAMYQPLQVAKEESCFIFISSMENPNDMLAFTRPFFMVAESREAALYLPKNRNTPRGLQKRTFTQEFDSNFSGEDSTTIHVRMKRFVSGVEIPPVEISTTEPPIESSTSELPIESSTAEPPVESSTSKLPVESSTAELPIERSTSELPVESSPAGLPAESSDPSLNILRRLLCVASSWRSSY